MEKAVFTYTPKPKTGKQATLHQDEGAKTAILFGEPHRTSLYARIFKKYPLDRAKLIECREWVMKIPDAEIKKSMGAAFMSSYKSFLNPKPFKPKQ